ncbi:MAG: alpha-ketoacid dehydrogenase subunit beta [Elusimicrobia bacterium]|nr:alpha-ketoacid dehydrogenase subunit beta [Elusimicrobiota bacterium]
MRNSREIKYTQAVNEAIFQCMKKDSNVFIIGEGVPDPKGIFGTTLGLKSKFGKERVMDMPVAENALTGIAIGAAISGMRPIMTHQRMDFMLYAMEPIINNAAKWKYMFGGKSIPLVIRTIIGRGWGQGAQHSQNLQALFAHIPGLKVVMPTTAYDAKGLLISSIEDEGPVVFIEHRWLHNTTSNVPKEMYRIPIGKCKKVKNGKDITIVSHSYMTVEAIRASEIFKKSGISVEIIDLRTVKPIDFNAINKSVNKTGRLLVLDSAWKTAGLAAEIIASVVENDKVKMKKSPKRITFPDMPTPTSQALTKFFYPGVPDIIMNVAKILDISPKETKNLLSQFKPNILHDIPDKSFIGPF